MIRSLASRLYWHRYLSKSARGAPAIAEVATFSSCSPTQQRDALAARLLAQVQYFGSRADALPEWREAARIADPLDLWRVWPSLPVVSKDLLRTRFPPDDMAARFGLFGQAGATGGSTGEPVHFFHDRRAQQAYLALHTYTRRRMGWRPGMATLIVWGAERDIGKSHSLKSRVSHLLLRDHLIAGYHAGPHTAAHVLRLLRTCAPVAMYGFSSLLELVAGEVLSLPVSQRPTPGQVRTAWNGGEMLYDRQIELFRQAFHVPILNRYGSREMPVMACQFDRAQRSGASSIGAGSPLSVLRPWIMVEVVDEHDRPVGPGEAGRLLLTSTVCRGTPFLRYDIGDLGSFAAGHQDESGISALDSLVGRSAGIVRLADGRKVNNIFWNHLFKEFREVEQFQIVVRPGGELRLLLRGPGLSPPREDHLRATLRNFLGAQSFDLCWVPEIPKTAQGKRVQVVYEPAPHGAEVPPSP